MEFAGGEERTSSNIKVDKSQFERVKGNKKLIFDVAKERSFLKQIEKADVIYIGGGVVKGLGLVPVKIIPHYDGVHEEEFEGLSKGLESLFLPSYQYKIFKT